jgi:hypothetical protein
MIALSLALLAYLALSTPLDLLVGLLRLNPKRSESGRRVISCILPAS